MNVLLAGATGAIGVPLTRQLLAAGHRVTGITRTPANGEKLRALGAEPLVADAMDRDALLRAVDGIEADVVVHELTALKDASPRLRADDPTNALRTRGSADRRASIPTRSSPAYNLRNSRLWRPRGWRASPCATGSSTGPARSATSSSA